MISEPVAINFFDRNTKTDLLVFLDSVLIHLASNKSTNPPLILVNYVSTGLEQSKEDHELQGNKPFQINI